MSRQSAADTHEQNPAPPAPRPKYERALLITVLVLGLLIVAGLAAVLARIIYLSSATPEPAPVQRVEVEDDSKASAALPFDGTLSIPDGAVVKSTSLSGSRLAVVYETPDGTGIAIVDLVTGRTLGRLRTAPASPGR